MRLQYSFARVITKMLKPGEQLTGKGYKLFQKQISQEQPYQNVQEIRANYEVNLGESYRNGFTAEELSGQNEMIKKALSLNNATPGEIMQCRIDQAIKKYQRQPLDTSSPAVQAAVLSERIISSMVHMENNRQDTYGARKFRMLLSQRRKALNFVKRKEYHMYKWLITDYQIIDVKFGNQDWMIHKHSNPQQKKNYARVETNRNRRL